ncbi:hypothetical protein SUGI_0054400 [Cryptomeria japonica]|uniref:uncharacterized protein LOC131065333 n=1 Tax=Cryptomeria japonica TaxID=3369 RepID=UPI002408BC0E|nr:uncharacterized protein LOC131065333 [Cryptomeria japonica]GLJ06972.1 hypothetical protein SUGI_0054400 [Cryptomeria japonica]
MNSVFEEAVIRQQFEQRGINLKLISLIWKYLAVHENVEAYEVPGLSKAACDVLRTNFKSTTSTVKATVKSADQSTTKLLIQLQNGSFVETVIMSYDSRLGTYAGRQRPGGPRATLCVSSQVGCKMGCTFCATGSMGFKSNLSAGEIVEQLVHASRLLQIRNVVFMGMGEPLNNYNSVVEAIRSMTGQCFQIAPRHITISTVGVIPRINSLKYDLPNVNLAVSLHAPLQEVRCQIMPAARAYPLRKLMDTLRSYQEHCKRKIFIEYIMLDGINDQEDQAHQLGTLLEEREVVVNLIPFNPIGSISKFSSSTKENIELFQKVLRNVYNIRTTVRQEMGQDISGACGQLLVKFSGENSINMEYGRQSEGIPDIEDLSL